jgi:hypothetical protein
MLYDKFLLRVVLLFLGVVSLISCHFDNNTLGKSRDANSVKVVPENNVGIRNEKVTQEIENCLTKAAFLKRANQFKEKASKERIELSNDLLVSLVLVSEQMSPAFSENEIAKQKKCLNRYINYLEETN